MVTHSGEIMLNSKRNTYVLTQTDHSYRKLGTLCLQVNRTKMKTLCSFINAVLFCKNRLISGCRKQELDRQHAISLLLCNVLIVIVTGTHSLCFAESQIYFSERKLGLKLSFFRKATSIFLHLRPDCKKDPVLELYFKNQGLFRKTVPNSGPVLDFCT